MTHEEFDKTSKRLLTKAAEVRRTKRLEYSSDEDERLSNFKTAARLNSQTVPEAVNGMMSKHVVSIADMVRDEFTRKEAPFSLEMWEEKIIDNINYLMLLYAAIKER